MESSTELYGKERDFSVKEGKSFSEIYELPK